MNSTVSNTKVSQTRINHAIYCLYANQIRTKLVSIQIQITNVPIAAFIVFKLYVIFIVSIVFIPYLFP